VSMQIMIFLTYWDFPESIFLGPATDSEALTDFQEFLMSRQIITFFTSRDHPRSIFLVCDLFLDSRKLSALFGANRDNYNFDIFCPSRDYFVGLRLIIGHFQTFRNLRANADNDILL
jgi:hypothetical protein